MKALGYIICLSMAVVLYSCGSGRQWTAQQDKEYQQLKDFVASTPLRIISNRAMPVSTAAYNRVANSGILGPGNNAGSIDLTSNANEIVIKKDSVSGYLPFYGEQYMGGGYSGGSRSGIEFDGKPKDYKLVEDDDRHAVDIYFKIPDSNRPSEMYQFKVTLYPGGNSSVNLQSVNRSTIDYSGRYEAYKKKE